jgi:branched-chain amino acid transport system permease protein
MMLMLGGLGSIPGCIIGGTVITILPEYLRFLKDYYWLVFSVIVLVTSVVLPNGLISIVNPIRRWMAKSKGAK